MQQRLYASAFQSDWIACLIMLLLQGKGMHLGPSGPFIENSAPMWLCFHPILYLFDIGILGSLAAPCFRGKPNRSSMLSQDSNKIVVRPIHDEKIKSDSIEMFKLSLVSGLPFGSLLQRIGAVVKYESWPHLFRCNKSQSKSWLDFVPFVVAIDQITHQNS